MVMIKMKLTRYENLNDRERTTLSCFSYASFPIFYQHSNILSTFLHTKHCADTGYRAMNNADKALTLMCLIVAMSKLS